MPFDATPQVDNKLAVYQSRRVRAAALWKAVPRKKFHMDSWFTYMGVEEPLDEKTEVELAMVATSCGTTACALGWLAFFQHDGWFFKYGSPRWQGLTGRELLTSYAHAQYYFGLTYMEAINCFSTGSTTAKFHHRSHSKYVGPADVAKTLLTLPYCIDE